MRTAAVILVVVALAGCAQPAEPSCHSVAGPGVTKDVPWGQAVSPVSPVAPVTMGPIQYRGVTTCYVCSLITGQCYDNPWKKLFAEDEWRRTHNSDGSLK